MKTQALVLLLCVCGGFAFEDKSISQWLTDNGFGVLVNELKQANIYETLNGGGPFTLFAPTDAAFNALSPATLSSLSTNPHLLKSVLMYHVIGGFLVQPMISTGFTKLSLNGQELSFTKNSTTHELYVNQAHITSGDNILNNGVVHVIDSVLMPLTDSIPEVLLKAQGRFSDLILALTLTDLLAPLMSGDYTLFAPTNDAFSAIQAQLPEFSAPNAKAIYTEILKNHVVNGTYMASDLRNGQSLPTLHGLDLQVDITSPAVKVGGASVIEADLNAINGVIHVINKVIVPTDVNV